MDRQIPVFNKLVMNKIHHDNMQKHYKNLITIRKAKKKPNPINPAPSKPNSKSMQLQEERKTEIDKNNVMLFQKMDRILKRDDPYNQTVGPRPNSKRNNHHYDKIYEENKKLVERLSQLKPTIDNKKLSQERKRQLNILKFIGKYSPNSSSNLQNHMFRSKDSQRVVGKTLENENRYRIKTENFKGDDEDQSYKFIQNWNMNLRPKYNRQNNVFKRQKNAEQAKHHIHSSLTHYQQEESNREERVLTEHSQPQNRSINLFKTIKQTEHASFSICITRTHDHYQITLEEISEEGQCFRLELEEEKGKQLLEAIDYDYQYLVDRLYIEDGQLAIQEDLSSYKEDSRSRQINRITPQVKPRKISQIFLPSHITQQNEEEFSLHQQTTFLKNQPQNNQNQAEEIENRLQQQQSPINQNFQSFGNSHQIEDF